VNRSFFLGGAIGLALGLVVALFSYQVGRAGGLLRAQEPVVAAPTSGATPAMPAMPPQPSPPPGAGGGGDAAPAGISPAMADQINALELLVKADPKNREAWVHLGNIYFDAHQPRQSVDAYARALQLQPDDPNVLTDQGVMYRELHEHQKALANFQKANRLQPTHVQSLYNQGVVYGFDLHDRAKAIEIWNRVIQLAPQSEDAARARAALAELQGP
jgi:tetratricopeptide (TPR) repeat protein